MPGPDHEALAAAWRLCRHLLDDDAAATRAVRAVASTGTASVADLLGACRAAASSAPRPAAATSMHRRAVLALTPAIAAAVVLRVVDDLPLPSVAAALGVPRTVAAARVRAGLAALGPGAAAALRVDDAAAPAVPAELLRPQPARAATLVAAAIAAGLALAAIAMPAQPVRVEPVAATPAPVDAEPIAFGLDLGEPPTTAADDGDAVDVQAWVFTGTTERFAELGLAAPAPVQAASLLGRLQRAAAARELQAHALPIAATAAGGRAYLGSYRNVTLLHGDRPDLPARPARLGALVEGVITGTGDGVRIEALVAQHARLVGAAAPGGARIDVDRAPISVTLRRARLDGPVDVRPDQVVVLPLVATIQRPALVAPAPFDAEPELAPRQLVVDRLDELAGDAAIVVIKAAPRASAFDGEGDVAPSSLSMR